jgi:2-methylcitrate dehydratase PrpD
VVSSDGRAKREDRDSPYEVAFIDWLACASAGADERAARAMRASGDDLLATVAFAATAGHVLDFDDTFAAGVAHVSAPCAPAALVVAARLGLSVGAMMESYAEGFEAMAAVAAASHPHLYDAGWHPTTVCGPVGAAVAASRLLGLSAAQHEMAVSLALLRTGGSRGAFGSDGKAIQVGLAAAAGVQAAWLARAGATVDANAVRGSLGFEGVVGGRWPATALQRPAGGGAQAGQPLAIERNWIKLYPSCLGTHSPIEAAARARAAGYRLGGDRVTVHVHPLARQAAHVDTVSDGLTAKFSIPYCVAYTLCHHQPGPRDLATVDSDALDQSRLVDLTLDDSLPDFGSVLSVGGSELARVPCPRGAPERPVTASDLSDKITGLAGDRLDGILADPGASAEVALDAAGLCIGQGETAGGRARVPEPSRI